MQSIILGDTQVDNNPGDGFLSWNSGARSPFGQLQTWSFNGYSRGMAQIFYCLPSSIDYNTLETGWHHKPDLANPELYELYLGVPFVGEEARGSLFDLRKISGLIIQLYYKVMPQVKTPPTTSTIKQLSLVKYTQLSDELSPHWDVIDVIPLNPHEICSCAKLISPLYPHGIIYI